MTKEQLIYDLCSRLLMRKCELVWLNVLQGHLEKDFLGN